jgi:Mg-chelatase subunit ChlD
LIILKRWEKVWQDYENKPETILALQGIYYLLSHPDLKNIYEFNILGVTDIFSDPMSLKQVIQKVTKYVKNRHIEDSIKTITKGISKLTQESSSTFQVVLQDKEFNKITFKRKKITSYRKGIADAASGLPVVSWTSMRVLQGKLHIYQTVKAAILDGSFVINPFHIQIRNEHFRYPIFQQKQNFNIMLVLDISSSVKWILKFMEKIISLLTIQARASKDKLGLIIFNDDRAQIMHYPTTNIRHVIGTINTLAPKGKTPLADGLKLAMQTLEHSRFQVTGMSNAIVLLSDCFPEPITYEHKDPLDEPVCQQILHVCDKIAESKIKMLILNPSLNDIPHYEQMLGCKLGKKAAEHANGSFLNLRAEVSGSLFSKTDDYVLPDHMYKELMKEVGEFKIN